jgi:hypothetical protein
LLSVICHSRVARRIYLNHCNSEGFIREHDGVTKNMDVVRQFDMRAHA